MTGQPWRLRLQQLAERHRLSPQQSEQLERLLSVLVSDPRAPTSLRTLEQALEGHVADSLVSLELEAVRNAGTIADLGSGAGYPGLPLAIALERSKVWLLESQARKCAYLEGAVAQTQTANAEVVCSRVEEWSGQQDGVDVVVARALAAQQVVVEYAAPLLRRGGVLVDWRGRRARDEEHKATLAAERLGMQALEIRKVLPFPAARDRHLHLYVKVSETPAEFPRRAGVASKRPLAGRIGKKSASS
jgi:16S rRNA (guanine527-N7)-methyltransferase